MHCSGPVCRRAPMDQQYFDIGHHNTHARRRRLPFIRNQVRRQFYTRARCALYVVLACWPVLCLAIQLNSIWHLIHLYLFHTRAQLEISIYSRMANDLPMRGEESIHTDLHAIIRIIQIALQVGRCRCINESIVVQCRCVRIRRTR